MRSVFALLLLLLVLTACAKPKPEWTALPDVETLLQRVAETTGQFNSLDGEATVSIEINGKFFSVQQLLLVEKPDRLRADILTGFGQLVLQLTSDGDDLSVFSNMSSPGRFYQGVASAENLSRFTRIPLATKDLVRLILYDPPMIAFQQNELLVEDGDLLLRLVSGERTQELLFNQQLQLSGCRYFVADDMFLEVLYEKIDPVKIYPQTVRINLVAQATRAAIKFSELQTNIEIPAERFRLKAPKNIVAEPLP